jgi:hypothetical protein
MYSKSLKWEGLLLGSALFSAACGHSPTAPSSPQGDFVLAETSRFATLLHVKVKGELTEKKYEVTGDLCPPGKVCLASGWYVGGTAFYYQPHIITYEFPLLTDIAAHETCHAIEPGHNALHKACIRSVGANPTYASACSQNPMH